MQTVFGKTEELSEKLKDSPDIVKIYNRTKNTLLLIKQIKSSLSFRDGCEREMKMLSQAEGMCLDTVTELANYVLCEEFSVKKSFKDCNVSETVKSAVGTVKSKASALGIKIKTDIEPDVICRCDRLMLGISVVNLLINAVSRYVGSGKQGTIEVEVKTVGKDAAVTVSDGCLDELDKYRSSIQSMAIENGTKGMYLLSESANGKSVMEFTDGKGTSAVITLPISETGSFTVHDEYDFEENKRFYELAGYLIHKLDRLL